MWQPEQPSSQTVASVGLRHGCIAGPARAVSGTAGTAAGPCCLSAMDRPFSKSAPVGQTCTHLPQLVHVVDSPHGCAHVGDDAGVDAASP